MIELPRLNSKWSVIFFLLPSVNLYFFNIGYIKPFLIIWKSMVILISTYIFYKYINKFSIILIIFTFINIFSSFVNRNISIGIIYSSFVLLSTCIYISYLSKYDFKELITGMYYMYSFIIIANFLSMTLYPDGISQKDGIFPIYLLGGKNAIQMILLPSIYIIYLYSYTIYEKMKIIPFIVILISVISMYMSESGTGVTVSIASMIFLLMYKKINLKGKTYILIYILIFFSIVVFRLQEVLFKEFIVDILHKDITLTGRVYIWDLVLKNIKMIGLIGLGRGNTFILDNFYLRVNETHNGFLEVFLYSGIIGLTIFLIMVWMIIKKLDKFYGIHSKILSFGIFTYMIIGISESAFYKMELWIIFSIAYNIEYIVRKQNTKELKYI
ncbi:Lipid A core--O-antigen ligase-like protein [[Clostridium] sordellii]|nr:Lipid A core--O-antigen ligase-like protein [[Clostridium] sordellii] [Paeniclostridium sordellii]